jgi:hypothetical protein
MAKSTGEFLVQLFSFRFNLKVPIRERSKRSVKVYENPVADAGDESIYSK